MTKRTVKTKWRPTLSMIVFTVLIAVMALPLVGLFFFRLYENQIIRQTESELISQSAVLAAILVREVETAIADGIVLGAQRPADLKPRQGERFQPVLPSLDLASDEVRDRRPPGVLPVVPASAAFVKIGTLMSALADQTQKVTLAGFRILDPNGIVIGGSSEVGLALDHVEEVASALRGRYRSVLRVRISDEPPPPVYSLSRGTGIRVFAAFPVFVGDRVAGVIYTSRTPSNILKHLYEERRKVALAAFTILGVTFLTGFIFLRVITRPIHGLIRYTAQIGYGRQDSARLPAHHGSREIAKLAQSFMDMAQRLSERSDYIANFAAHVSHELKSPLTSIQGAAELMRDGDGTMTASEREKFLSNIVKDTERLTALLERLRDLARADNPQERGPVSLATVLSDVRLAFPDFAFHVDGDAGRTIMMSRENAAIIFKHLADNAQRHNASRMRVQILSETDRLCVTVSDDGDGISDNNRERIFDPFFTTRREAGGTGMGLGIVRSMLSAHGGSIRLVPSTRGATFEIEFPAG